MAHEFLAEMESALRVEYFTGKGTVKCTVSYSHMLRVTLFNFSAPKHIVRSFLLAYFTELNLQMINTSQSITELQRILPGFFSSTHIHSSHVMAPHGSFVPSEFHNQL